MLKFAQELIANGKLTIPTPKPTKTGRQLARETIQRGECPDCGETMEFCNGIYFHEPCHIKVISTQIFWRG